MEKKINSFLIGIGYFCIYFAAQFLVVIPTILFMGFSAVLNADIASILTIISNFITIFVFMLITKLRKQKIKEEYYFFKAPAFKAVFIAVTGILLNIFVSFALEYLSETFALVKKCMDDYVEQASMLTDITPVLYIIFAVILAPVTEELIFRAGIYRVIKRDCSFIAATFISSLFFGIAHANLVWSTYAFLLGILLCIIYEKYHSIAANIILHLCFNLTSTFIDNVFSSGDYLQTRDYIVGISAGVVSVILLVFLLKGKSQDPVKTAELKEAE